MAAPAWSAGVTGAYELSSMAGKMGQIVQRLCRVQFRHVPFYAACYTIIGPLKVPSEVGSFLGKLTRYPDFFLPHIGRSYPLYSLPRIFENLSGL